MAQTLGKWKPILDDTDLRVQAMQLAVAVFNGGHSDERLKDIASDIYWFLRGPVEENVPIKEVSTPSDEDPF